MSEEGRKSKRTNHKVKCSQGLFHGRKLGPGCGSVLVDGRVLDDEGVPVLLAVLPLVLYGQACELGIHEGNIKHEQHGDRRSIEAGRLPIVGLGSRYVNFLVVVLIHRPVTRVVVHFGHRRAQYRGVEEGKGGGQERENRVQAQKSRQRQANTRLVIFHAS